jgi:hypothetical protein
LDDHISIFCVVGIYVDDSFIASLSCGHLDMREVGDGIGTPSLFNRGSQSFFWSYCDRFHEANMNTFAIKKLAIFSLINKVKIPTTHNMMPFNGSVSSSVSTTSTSLPPEPLSQQELLNRLIDSHEAMEAVQDLTRDLGTFVIKSRVLASKKRDSSPAHLSRPLKRKRLTKEALEPDHTATAKPSVRRMQLLYEHLQKTQALFKLEIAKFIDETEEDCIKQEAQNIICISAE